MSQCIHCLIAHTICLFKRFLPPKFDYGRPIPASLLPRPISNPSNGTSEIELGPLLNGDSPASPNGVARNRRGGGNRARLGSRAEDTGTTSMSEDTTEIQTLDCVICYNEIDVNDRKGYMLAPCDHIFHRHCLEQWMDVKVSHYLLLHEVGLPHPCAKCSFLFFPRWNVQYVGVICLPFRYTNNENSLDWTSNLRLGARVLFSVYW